MSLLSLSSRQPDLLATPPVEDETALQGAVTISKNMEAPKNVYCRQGGEFSSRGNNSLWSLVWKMCTILEYFKLVPWHSHITAAAVPHELASEDSRTRNRVVDFMNAQRMLGGTAHAEQLLLELNSAAQINRGPDGIFESSRLHWDLILGRDDRIYPSDYLNFDSKMKC